MNQWTPPRDAHAPGSQKRKTLCPEEIDGVKQSLTQRGPRTISGKSYVSIVMGKGISLAIAPRNSDSPANDASGNHALAPVEIDKLKSNQITSKYVRSVMTALRNKEPKTGSPTSLTSKTTSKSSSCNKCWEQKGRIFKTLEPDGLGESYSL